MTTATPTATVAGPSRDQIQQAIDSLPPGGGTVVVPSGRYVIDTSLRLGSGTTLQGAGPSETTLVLGDGANTHVLVNRDPHDGNEQIAVRDLTIDGNRPAQDLPPRGVMVWSFGIWFRGVRGVAIDRVVIRQVRQNGIQLNDCADVRINRVRTHDMGWSGVATTRTDGLVIRTTEVHGAGLDTRHSGIHLDGAIGAYVDAQSDDCAGNAVMVDSVAGPVRGVTVRATGRRSQRGLALVAGPEHPLDTVVVTGTYSDNLEVGILVSNATGVSVLDATLSGNGQAGIVLQGARGTRHCVVADCRISGSPERVVRSGADAHNLVTGVTDASTPAPAAAPVPPAGPLRRVARRARRLLRR